jgi:Growth-Arrest-Specific Protein 2 Domain
MGKLMQLEEQSTKLKERIEDIMGGKNDIMTDIQEAMRDISDDPD